MSAPKAQIRLRPSLLFLLLVAWPLFANCSPLLLDEEIETVYLRRVADIMAGNRNPDQANTWRNQLTAQGNWADVDYTTGCPARRANWPAQDHFHRINQMATLWYDEGKSDADLLAKIHLALDHWFGNDFDQNDCINAGGRLNCPCGTPGFWNTNWYCQMILMPGLVGNACQIMMSHLTQSQLASCIKQTTRAYVRIDGDPNGSMGPMTGANMLDVASTGVTIAILTSDRLQMENSLEKFYNEGQFALGFDDGIKHDGPFMQHSMQIYNGNYGATFMRQMLKMFLQTGSTSFEPPENIQIPYLTVIGGSEWFIYRKNDPNDVPRLSWQYSVIGRMVSHKYQDWRGIALDLNELLEGTKAWPNHAAFQEIVARLNTSSSIVNPGNLVGTRFFHSADYMVHRASNYIVTLKMFSTRTTNSECNNNQNPYGFHLSDGNIYTYLNGNEYTNVYGAWDWNLIPGTTVDYAATPLECGRVQFKSKESFVGGVALGEAGLAAMTYTNPMTSSLHWLKTYFFFPNSYIVQFVGEAVPTNPSAPVVTTLDQRQLSGNVYIDGRLMTEQKVRVTAQTLWHDRVGYRFLYPVTLNVDVTPRRANWAAIGISIGNETQTHFTAYFEHPENGQGNGERYTYTVSLDVDQQQFETMAAAAKHGKKMAEDAVEIIKNDGSKSGSGSELLEAANVRGATFGNAGDTTGSRIISLAFLSAGEYFTGLEDITRVDTGERVLLVFQRKEGTTNQWRLAVSDPTQALTQVRVSVYLGGVGQPVDLNIELPSGPWAGSTAVYEF